jgi:hypothetical protein
MLLRRKLTVLLMTMMVLVVSAAPALAASDKSKRPQPTEPPGYANGQQPSQAAFPETGGGTRIKHGNPQNGD